MGLTSAVKCAGAWDLLHPDLSQQYYTPRNRTFGFERPDFGPLRCFLPGCPSVGREGVGLAKA